MTRLNPLISPCDAIYEWSPSSSAVAADGMERWTMEGDGMMGLSEMKAAGQSSPMKPSFFHLYEYNQSYSWNNFEYNNTPSTSFE